jgi:hypothetical protein
LAALPADPLAALEYCNVLRILGIQIPAIAFGKTGYVPDNFHIVQTADAAPVPAVYGNFKMVRVILRR